MDMSDERDYAEEAANQRVLEEEAHEEAKELEEEAIQNEIQAQPHEEAPSVKKRMKYTITFTADFPDDECYEGVTAKEAKEAGLELPIDTYEKKLVWELHSLREGYLSIAEIMDDVADKEIEYEARLVDDETDPNYLKQDLGTSNQDQVNENLGIYTGVAFENRDGTIGRMHL
jgi:hypothetical protein